MDLEGDIYLSDFGVSAHVKQGHKRQTFVGSPCWMAPEVMEQSDGYDFKADIWSLGVTAIELAQGDAPNSELPAMRVLLVILNSAPPTLSKHEDWSIEFRNFVSSCLQKEPEKRMSTDQLFSEHKKFFDKAKDSNYIKQSLLSGLEPLESRQGKGLIQQANEYFQKKNRKNLSKKSSSSQSQVQWDFGSSGDQSKIKESAMMGDHKPTALKQEPVGGCMDDDFDFGLDEKE